MAPVLAIRGRVKASSVWRLLVVHPCLPKRQSCMQTVMSAPRTSNVAQQSKRMQRAHPSRSSPLESERKMKLGPLELGLAGLIATDLLGYPTTVMPLSASGGTSLPTGSSEGGGSRSFRATKLKALPGKLPTRVSPNPWTISTYISFGSPAQVPG